MRLYDIEICRVMKNLAVYAQQRTHYVVTQKNELYKLDVLPENIDCISLLHWKEMLYQAYKQEVEKYLATPWNKDVYSISLATNEYHVFSFYANNVQNYKEFREKYPTTFHSENDAYYWKYHLGNFSYETEAQSDLIFKMQRNLNIAKDVLICYEDDETKIADYNGNFDDIEIVFDSLIMDFSNYMIVKDIANRLKDYVYEHVKGAPDFIFYASADGETIDRSFAIREFIPVDVLHRIRPDLKQADERFEQEKERILQLPILEQVHYWGTEESYELTDQCHKSSYTVMEILLEQLQIHRVDVIELWKDAFVSYEKSERDIFQASLLTYILYEMNLHQTHHELLHNFLNNLNWENINKAFIIKEIRDILYAEEYRM